MIDGDYMNKAFTLIELLGVIIILAIIVLIAVPQIMTSLNNSKSRAYDMNVSSIEKAASQYVTENASQYSNQDSFQISLDNLCDSGYLDCPVVNPITNDDMTGNVNVTKNDDGTFSYQYIDE